jgi:hypothetical protein
MRIENLRSIKNGNKSRVSSTVIWEDSEHPVSEIYFETDEEFSQGLSCNPHAFLIGCIMPAMHLGEKRVYIDAEVSPEILEGVVIAMRWISLWRHKQTYSVPRIEAKTKTSLSVHRPQRAGIFFSGGIDSLGTLRYNRLNFSLDHPWSIKDGLLVFGLETDTQEKFDYVLSSLSALAKDANITLIPVYTNLRYLEDDWSFWEHVFQDAVLSAIAHAFSKRFTAVTISSTYDIPNIKPYGTHPLLAMSFTSSDLMIRYDGIILSRFDKIKLLADWDVALKNIRVCNRSELYKSDLLNCGECNKCVRTMLELMAIGVLHKATAFPEKNISGELLRSVMNIPTLCFFEELIDPLKEKGHHKLALIIEQRIGELKKQQKRNKRQKEIVQRVKEFDHRYLNGNLKKFVLQVRQRGAL